MQYPQYLPDGLGGHSSSGYKGKCGNKSNIKKPETMAVRDFTLMGVRRLYCKTLKCFDQDMAFDSSYRIGIVRSFGGPLVCSTCCSLFASLNHVLLSH